MASHQPLGALRIHEVCMESLYIREVTHILTHEFAVLARQSSRYFDSAPDSSSAMMQNVRFHSDVMRAIKG